MTSIFDINANGDGSTGVWWKETVDPALRSSSRINVYNLPQLSADPDHPLPTTITDVLNPTWIGRIILRTGGENRNIHLSIEPDSISAGVSFTPAVEDIIIVGVRIAGTQIAIGLTINPLDQDPPYSGVNVGGFTGLTPDDENDEDSIIDAFIAAFDATTTGTQLDVALADTSNLGFMADILEIGEIPLTADAGENQTVSGGDAVQLDGASSFGPIDSYLWEQTTGTNVFLSNSNSANASFTAPTPSATTTLSFRLTVTDEDGNTNADIVQVIIFVNLPPTAEAGPNQSVQTGNPVTLSGSGTDEDGTIASYLWEQTTGTNIVLDNPNAASITFVAPDTIETLTFRLTVTDNNGSTGTDTIQITILAIPNIHPMAVAGNDQEVSGGTTVQLNGAGSTDEDGSIVTYLWEQIGLPAVVLSDNNLANASFTAPALEQETTLIFQLTVTDDRGDEDTDEVNITVLATANIPPTANAGQDATASPGDVVRLIGSATDQDGTIDTYLWEQVSGTNVFLTNPNSTTASFFAPNTAGDLSFRLTATDDDGDTGTDTVIITVVLNQEPVADAGSDQNRTAGTTINLDGSASNDPDGTTLDYLWTQVAGETQVLDDNQSATPSFDIDSLIDSQTLTFRLTVTDADGAQDQDTVDINITELTHAPTADAGPDQTVSAGTVVRLDGAGSTDFNGTIVSYRWEQIPNTTVALSSRFVTRPVFVAPAYDTETLLSFRLTVEDDDGNNDSDDVIITVEAYTPPQEGIFTGAYLFQMGDDIIVTTHVEDIDLNGKTYEAKPIIISIGPTQISSNFPSHQIEIEAEDQSPEYHLLKKETGLKPSSIYYVEREQGQWITRWGFKGIVSGGRMIENKYTTTLKHEIELVFLSPKERYWNQRTQKSRSGNARDKGLDEIHYIRKTMENLRGWKGVEA